MLLYTDPTPQPLPYMGGETMRWKRQKSDVVRCKNQKSPMSSAAKKKSPMYPAEVLKPMKAG